MKRWAILFLAMFGLLPQLAHAACDDNDSIMTSSEGMAVGSSAGALDYSGKLVVSGATATTCLACTVNSGPIRYKTDGTNPTASSGTAVDADGSFTLTSQSQITNFRVIRSTAESSNLFCEYRYSTSGDAVDSAVSTATDDTQVLFNDGEVLAGDAGMTYNKTTNALTVDSLITSGESSINAGTGGLDFVDSNIIFLGISDDIESAVTAATAGDTIVLASGTYTVTDDIDITKAINIVGQGTNKTIISCATDSKNIFDISASNVKISDLAISSTGNGGGSQMIGAWVLCTGGTSCTGVEFRNISITMSGTGDQWGMLWTDSGGNVKNISCSVTSINDRAHCIEKVAQSTMEVATTLNVTESLLSVSQGGTTGFAIGSRTATTPNISTLNLYNSNATSVETASATSSAFSISATGGTDTRTVVKIYNSTLSGSDNDILEGCTPDCPLTLYDTTLVNNLVSGTITSNGAIITNQIRVLPITQQFLAAAETITANACYAIKPITSNASITTNTTNTFTTPASATAGCIMDVVNVGNFNITLDANANFLTYNGADVVLGQYDSVRVGSAGVGSPWYQLQSPSYNN